jgi:hypothetical protein
MRQERQPNKQFEQTGLDAMMYFEVRRAGSSTAGRWADEFGRADERYANCRLRIANSGRLGV